MSSQTVRDQLNAAIEAAAAPLPVYDLSDYESSAEVLPEVTSQAVLVQYIASDERMASIGGQGNQGWEEQGTVVLHMVTPVGFDSDPLVAKGDEIRLALRGRRLGDITIESCEPFTDFGGSSVGISGGAWKDWASNLFYVKRDCG